MVSSALHLNILCAGKSLILEILTTSKVLYQYMDVEKILLHQKYPSKKSLAYVNFWEIVFRFTILNSVQ